MKKIRIVSIIIEGFRSYATPVKFSFDKTVLYLVLGANGSGKSSIFSALYWALYSHNLNDTNNDKVQTYLRLRPQGYKGTRVVVDMVADGQRYRIARHLNYSGQTLGLQGDDKLMIFTKPATDKDPFTDKHMVGDPLYKNDQQNYINKLLGISYKAFLHSIIFGQRMSRLIGADGKEKRELFEELFEMGFVDVMKERADKKAKELETTITGLQTTVTTKKQLITSKEESLAEKRTLIANFEADKKQRLQAIRTEHETLKARNLQLQEELSQKQQAAAKLAKANGKKAPAVSLNDLFQKADVAQTNYNDAKELLRKSNKEVENTDNAIQAVERELVKLAADMRSVKETCNVCGSKLDKAKVEASKKNYASLIEAKEKEKLQLHVSREPKAKAGIKLQEQVTEQAKIFHDAYNAYEAAKAAEAKEVKAPDTSMLEGQIQAQKETLRSIKARYDKEKATEPPKIDIKELEAQIDTLHVEVNTITTEIAKHQQELDRVNWWISKGFGAKGLKSYIFSAMLQQLNEYALKYSSYFGYSIKFGIDMSKASRPFMTTIYDGEDETDYNDLSGGQKQRVDICLMFAMYDLVSFKTQFNIMVLDEIQEGLDAEGVALMNLILPEKANEKAIYMITHNPLFAASASRTITITGGKKEPSIIEQ